MSNLTKLEFIALDISGRNYLSWVLDGEIHLNAMNFGNTIKEGNQTSLQDRHHLHEELKAEYLTIKDPLALWNNLRERIEHQRTVILPKARYDWIHLRLQDFKTVSEYNSSLFKISSQMKLCGEKVTDEDMLEKTYSTFHASNVLLQQQYRERRLTKYSELFSCLLVAEQNNELLIKNHQSRPTGSAPFPEVNMAFSQGRGRGCGWRKKILGPVLILLQIFKEMVLKEIKRNGSKMGKTLDRARKCKTMIMFAIDVGQKAIGLDYVAPQNIWLIFIRYLKRQKEKNVKANLSESLDKETLAGVDFDIVDFFEDPNGKIDHLIGDENVYY